MLRNYFAVNIYYLAVLDELLGTAAQLLRPTLDLHGRLVLVLPRRVNDRRRLSVDL